MSYEQIKTAIEYIHANFRAQPSLEEVARAAHMSSTHFQKVFKNWVGISPKQFLQYTNIEYAKSRLKIPNSTLLSTSLDTGLSSTSRLHDLFLKIEGMTPGEYKNHAENLSIFYEFYETPFGQALVANTDKGLCYLAFHENEKEALIQIKNRYKNAQLIHQNSQLQTNAVAIFKKDWKNLPEIKLHLSGTPFQLKVWESLLTIPFGELTTYGDIAKDIGNPNANRAVGIAIGANPIAYLIPCHRVIQSTGGIGGYRWEPSRKVAMMGWEGARLDEGK
ncbi:MAG: bifunctional helix-turn-helix domain-containing protein/methylated-DNA--[protein]-cysteine S-methyltransferase [bacterium]|nr:bifunctional helix-turn-helix domain-containing protein/methylated-DNA--[protein]-cysteine S-methyltransferase [bacterium]